MRRIAGPALLLALIGCNAILGLDARTLSEDASPSDAAARDQGGSDGPSDSDVLGPGAGDDGAGSHADAGPDAGVVDAAPAPVHGKVILVNASAYAPALRFCYGSLNADGGDGGTATILQGFPFPNAAPGVAPGAGGPSPDTSVDRAGLTLEIYAISATSVASVVRADGGPELTCDQLVGERALAMDAGGLGLTQGVDYWDLGTLPAGTLADGTTTLLVITGCVPGETNDPAYSCPMPYPAAGNLGFSYAKLDSKTPLDVGSIGAQFAYASFPFFSASKLVGSAAAVAGFYVNTASHPEAGAPAAVTENLPIAEGASYGQLAPMALVAISEVIFDGGSGIFVNAVTADGGPTTLQVSIPLPSIQAISAPNADASIFTSGVGYVFVLVGDPGRPSFVVPPGADAGQFNPLSAHILAFSTNPPFGN